MYVTSYTQMQKHFIEEYWITDPIARLAYTPFSLIASAFGGRNQKKIPPSAPGHAFIGHWPELVKYNWDIMKFLISYAGTYGQKEGICKVQLITRIFYLVLDPQKIAHVLNNETSFPRGDSLEVWRRFSEGLKSGPEAQDWRKKAIHAIGAKMVKTYFPGTLDISVQWQERLQQKGSFDLFYETERGALAVMGEAFFKNVCENNPFALIEEKEKISALFLETYRKLFKLLSKRFISVIDAIPLVGQKIYSTLTEDDEKIERLKDQLKDILLPIFTKVFDNPNLANEHVKRLFETLQLDPKNVDIDDLLNKILGFIQAAFETGSKAMAWTYYLLGKHPNIQRKLQKDLRDHFGNDLPKNLDDLKKVPYLFKVLEEVLRLYPPFFSLLRDIVNPEDFPDYKVEKGGIFVISPLLANHNPNVWANPEVFCPGRWTDEMLNDSTQTSNLNYLTFIAGDHRCPGRFFAKQEIALFIASVLLKNEIVLDDPEQVPEMLFNITLHSKEQVMAHLV